MYFFQFCRSEIVEEGRKYISEFRSRRRRHVPRRRWDGGRGTPDVLTRHLLAISVVTMISWSDASLRAIGLLYSGTSLLRSPTGLVKSDFNGEVTLLQGLICTVEYNLGLSHGDCNGEIFLLVR